MPDRSSEREESLEDAGAHSRLRAPSVALEIELGLEGLVDRLGQPLVEIRSCQLGVGGSMGW